MRTSTYIAFIVAVIICLSVHAKEFTCTKYTTYPILLEETCDLFEGCKYPIFDKAIASVDLYTHPTKNSKIIDHVERCELLQNFVPYALITKPGRAKVITLGKELEGLNIKTNDILPLLQTLSSAWISVCVGNKEIIVYDTHVSKDLVSNPHEEIYQNSGFVKVLKPSQVEHWVQLKTLRGNTGYAMNDEKLQSNHIYGDIHSTINTPCSGDKAVPPKIYIDKGACPFECCTYRDWIAEGEIPIYSDLTKRKILGLLKQGEVVKALTGEVHIIPTKVRVVYNHGKYKIGDQFYLLTPLGEGYSSIWVNGELDVEELLSIYKYGGDPYCKEPSPECWVRLEPKEVGESIWWAKVKRQDGTIGWTDQAGSFGNQDACG